jgi:hypothetical protein
MFYENGNTFSSMAPCGLGVSFHKFCINNLHLALVLLSYFWEDFFLSFDLGALATYKEFSLEKLIAYHNEFCLSLSTPPSIYRRAKPSTQHGSSKISTTVLIRSLDNIF